MGEHKEIRGTIKGIGASPTEAERFVYELLNRINKKKKIKLKIEVRPNVIRKLDSEIFTYIKKPATISRTET